MTIKRTEGMTTSAILLRMLERYEAKYGEVKIESSASDSPLPEQKPKRSKKKPIEPNEVSR